MKWILYILPFSLFAQDTTLVSFGVGTFTVTETNFYDFADDVLHIKGLGPGTTVLKNTSGGMYNIRSPFVDKTFVGQSLRGEYDICVDNTTGVQAGDLVHISSDSVVETGWGYTESDLHEVVHVSAINNCITTRQALNFNYTAAVETVSVRFFRPKKVLIENLTFQCDAGYILGDRFVTVNGMYLEVKAVEFVNTSGGSPDGIAFAQCYRSRFKDISFDNFRYGCLINQSRDIIAENSFSENCRHAYVPATWTDGLTVSGLIGRNNRGVMDAHPSFNVTYRNVDARDTELSNCRAFGVTIEDCTFNNFQSYAQDYSYIGMSTAAQVNEEYQFLFSEYPIYINRCSWTKVDNRGRFNGLSIYWGGKILFTDCYTHSIAVHGGIVQDTKCDVLIKGCDVGHVVATGSNLNLKVCDSKIDHRIAPLLPDALNIDGAGERLFQNVDFLGWGSTDRLLRYMNAANSELPVFYNCNIPFIGDLVRTYQSAGSDYKLEFIRGRLDVGSPIHPRLITRSTFLECDTTFNKPPD